MRAFELKFECKRTKSLVIENAIVYEGERGWILMFLACCTIIFSLVDGTTRPLETLALIDGLATGLDIKYGRTQGSLPSVQALPFISTT